MSPAFTPKMIEFVAPEVQRPARPVENRLVVFRIVIGLVVFGIHAKAAPVQDKIKFAPPRVVWSRLPPPLTMTTKKKPLAHRLKAQVQSLIPQFKVTYE